MKLQLKFLIICLIIAFTAARTIEKSAANVTIELDRQQNPQDELSSEEIQDSTELIADTSEAENEINNEINHEGNANGENAMSSTEVNQNDPDPINRYCQCSSSVCKCCRDFALPIIPVRGPGCATVKYLEEDRMSVTIKYGDYVLASRTITGRKAEPVCLPLPGGYSRFCGRVYGISRKGENFKACLGLDLRADEEVEAALRVSCFNFGPRGVSLGEAEPLPPAIDNEDDDEEEDDDDDLLGLGGGDDEEDDDVDDDDDGPDGGFVGDILSVVT